MVWKVNVLNEFTGWPLFMRSITINYFLYLNRSLQTTCWPLDSNMLVCLYMCRPGYLVYDGHRIK